MTKKSTKRDEVVTAKSLATGLFVSGFQSLAKPTFIPIKPLTFLYGPNSAGKSAVIDAINLFGDFANHRIDRVWKLVAKWKQIELDELAARSRGFAGNGWMATGVQFEVGKGYKDELSKEVKELRTKDGESAHLDWVSGLIGRTVQIEINVRERDFAPGIRIAVDHVPLLEFFPFGSPGLACHRDGQFRRADDPQHDEADPLGDDVFDQGRLKLHRQHAFWRGHGRVDALNQYSKAGDVGATSEFIRQTDRAIEICDVDFDVLYDAKKRYEFKVGELLSLALSDDKWMRKKVMAWGGSRESRQASIAKVIRTPERIRSDLAHQIDSLLEDLGPFCRALLEVGAASLEHCHVPGDRSVIRPSATTFMEELGAYSAFHDEIRLYGSRTRKHAAGHPASAYFESFAAATAKAESRKARNLIGEYFAGRLSKPLVNEWLRELLPSMRQMQVRVDAYRVSALNAARGPVGGRSIGPYAMRLYVVDGQQRPLEFEDVGSGLSYVFPILVALWARRLSIVEQPELHLHPAAQCDMADVLIAAKNQRRVAIVESHSEHILLRLLRRIRETNSGSLRNPELSVIPDDVAILYFDPQSDGTTTAKLLRVSRVGDFVDRWPNGFFEERVQELFSE